MAARSSRQTSLIMESIESFIKNTKAKIVFDGEKAFYNDKQDFIQLPPRCFYPSLPQFYAAAFHELIHWTGHARRLDRLFFRSIKNSPNISGFYVAYEEVVAYIGEGLLFIHFGLNPDAQPLRQQNLEVYFKRTGESADVIPAAIKRARRAVRYLVNHN